MDLDARTPLSRRRWLALAGAGGLLQAGRAYAAPPPTGWVDPRLAAPPIGLTGDDHRPRTLSSQVAGRVSAVQLMFTGCNTSCPVQGALFAAIAGRLPAADVQLLSLSIDALGDTPEALGRWLARFGRHPQWSAAVPAVGDVDRLAGYLRGSAGQPGSHTAQVFVFDRQGRLCYRTGDAPPAAELLALLQHVAGSA